MAEVEAVVSAFSLNLNVDNERMASADKAMGWTEFSRTHPDLLDHSNTVLNHYYRPETLESPLARRTFVMPDRGD